MRTHRSSLFALSLAALLSLAGGLVRPSVAAADGVALADAQRDLDLFKEQLGEKKSGNEDLNGSIDAIAKAFFNLAPPTDPGPAPAADAGEDALKAHVLKVAQYDKELKDFPVQVKAYQEKALGLIVRGLRLVLFNPRNKENTRNDVNIKAAQVLGDLLGSPDLAKCPNAKDPLRDEKELLKMRSERSRELREVIAGDLTTPRQEYQGPLAVLEFTFAALGKMNDPKSLEWMRDEFIHTRNAPDEVDRLVSAHKAMILFKNVLGDMRFSVVQAMVTTYRGAEAQANAGSTAAADPKAKAQAASAKTFWDRVKKDAVAATNYYCTDASNKAPQTADGQALTTMEELARWWTDNNRKNRAPWLDPKN